MTEKEKHWEKKKKKEGIGYVGQGMKAGGLSRGPTPKTRTEPPPIQKSKKGGVQGGTNES